MAFTRKPLLEKDRDPICPQCERSSAHLQRGEREIGRAVRPPYTWAVYHPECVRQAKDSAVVGVCHYCRRTVRQFGQVAVYTRSPEGERRVANAQCVPQEGS